MANEKTNLIKKSMLPIAILGLFLSVNSQRTQAAKISLPKQGTIYVKKGNTYKLHLSAPGRVTINSKAKYTIKNTSNWTCIAYKGSSKNKKVFYLRAGNYKLTTKNKKKLKLKTSYTRFTKLLKQIEDYPLTKAQQFHVDPNKISMGQKIKGFSDMYQTGKYTGNHSYIITLDKPQKVILTYNAMPVYAPAKTNIYSDSTVSFTPIGNFNYKLGEWNMSGKAVDKKHSWYLAKGSYVMNVFPARGRFNFTINSEDTDKVPGQTKINNISATSEGIKVDYNKVNLADGYDVFAYPETEEKESYFNSNSVYGQHETENSFPNVLTQTIPKVTLVNGQTYKIAAIAKNNEDNLLGPVSTPVEYTYYVPLASNAKTPAAPKIKVSYYDDHGSDEPYISIKWDANSAVDSYEIAYRLKGGKWHYLLTRGIMTNGYSTGDEISGSDDSSDDDYFVKGRTYEVKVRALTGNLKSDWSNIASTTVTVTPAR